MIKCQVNGCENDENEHQGDRKKTYGGGEYGGYKYKYNYWGIYKDQEWARHTCNECHEYMINENNEIWDPNSKAKRERLKILESLIEEKKEKDRTERERQHQKLLEEERLENERLENERIQKSNEYLETIFEISGIEKKYMQTLIEYTNNNITNNLFYEGNINLGSINNRIWTDVHEKLQSLPDAMQKVNEHLENEKNTLQNINSEIRNIEKRKEILLKQAKEQEKKIEQLKESENNWIRFKSEKYEGFMQVANDCKEIENTLSTRLHEQLQTDVKGFSDMNDDSDNPKLSLVFNLVGLSSETISSLAEYDGELFIDCWEKSDSHSLHEAKDILYCKEMLNKGFIPYTDHEEECPVCNCQNADELYLLFEEYKMPICHDLLKKHQLNGRRLVGLSLNDIKQYFELPKDQIIPIMKSINKLKNLHKKSLKH